MPLRRMTSEARWVVGDAVVDLDAKRLLSPGGSASLTDRECALLTAMRGGTATASSLGLTPHVVKQVVYRLRRKLAGGVLCRVPDGYTLAVRRVDPSLVGRTQEYEAAEIALHQVGIALLVGPAGAGKTHLARSMVLQLEVHFEVVWIDAHRCRSPEDLQRATLRAFGFETLGQLESRLRNGTPAAIVLDNLEGISSLSIVSSWRPFNLENRWLLTSRHALPSLDVPQIQVGTLEREAAVELLRRRRAGVGSEQVLDRFDALPLILELVASKCREQGLQAVLGSGSFEVLEDSERTRHGSMHRLLSGMWDQLSGASREILTSLSLCCSTFDTTDAAELAGASPSDLAHLVAVSALEHRDRRFRMLEVIRDFAHDKAGASLPTTAHGAWTVRKARRLAKGLDDPEGTHALRGLTALTEDLHQVVETGTSAEHITALWCLIRLANHVERIGPPVDLMEHAVAMRPAHADQDLLRLELALYYRGVHEPENARRVLESIEGDGFEVRFLQAHIAELDRAPNEVLPAFLSALDAAETPAQRARALLLLSYAQFQNGQIEAGERSAREVLTLRISERHHLDAVFRLGLVLNRSTRHPEAVNLLREAYGLAASFDSPRLRVSVGGNFTIALYMDGRRDEAEAIALEIEEVARRTGFRGWAVQLELLRASIHVDRSEFKRAERLLAVETDNRLIQSARLGVLASLHMSQGSTGIAAAHLEQALELTVCAHHRIAIVYTQLRLAVVLALRGEIDRAEALLAKAEAPTHRMPIPSNHLLMELIRHCLRLRREPDLMAARVWRIADSMQRPHTHPDVTLAARWLQRAALAHLPDDFLATAAVTDGPDPTPAEAREDVMPRLVFGDVWVDLQTRQVLGARPASLTAIETRLLGTLAQNEGTPVPREDLLAMVWGYGTAVKTRTLDQAIYRLRRKLEPEPKCPIYLSSRYGKGYELRVDRGD